MKALKASSSQIGNSMVDKNCATKSLVLESHGKVVLAAPGRRDEYASEDNDGFQKKSGH